METKTRDTGTVHRPATIDGATLSVLPTRRKPRLTSLDGVRAEMSRIYREMESGRRDSQDGSRLVYALSQIGRVLELAVLERRLEALEQQHRLLPGPDAEATAD